MTQKYHSDCLPNNYGHSQNYEHPNFSDTSLLSFKIYGSCSFAVVDEFKQLLK